MSIIHQPLRYAHDEGHTDVCYALDGSKFITCGSDGDIRIWSTDDSEDPVHNCIGEWALCVRQKGDNLYVSTGSNDIQILSYPSGERNGFLDRFVAPINCISTNEASQYIALGGEDMEIKLINLDLDVADPTRKTVFTDLTGPCLSVALCPNSKLLAASSGDGKLRIWDIESKNLIKDIECFPHVNSFANAKVLCGIDFDRGTGELLAYPSNNSVIILNTNDWSQEALLKAAEITSDFTLVQFSPCSKFIAAASIEGDFAIFDVATKTLCSSTKHVKSTKITSFKWNPRNSEEIVYADAEGQVGVMSGCTTSSRAKIIESETFDDNEVNFEGFEFEDDDDDNENAISVEQIKKQVMGDFDKDSNFDELRSHITTPRPKTPEIPLQKHFMPSSTPEHLNPRYLCWNSIGIIRSYGDFNIDDSDKSIEIEFHDSSLHNSIMMQNFHEYTMGCVSKTAVIVANQSEINVIPLSADSKDWSMNLEVNSEEILLVTASENLIAFASDKYLLRIFSIYGIQRCAISIGAPIISINSYDNCLLLAYHSGGIRKEDQCVNFKLFTFSGFTFKTQELSSTLSPLSSVSWLGFTDKASPAVFDSSGILHIWAKRCNAWIPSCDTTKHLKSPADGFFVTAVFESQLALAGIKCKGSVYPVLTPRPTVCDIPLAPVFIEASTEKCSMEMKMFMWSNLDVANVGKSFTETGLKTFALACKNDLDKRALEFMEMISNPQLLNLGVKYALKMKKKKLAEKLMEMLNDDDDESDKISAIRVEPEIPKRFVHKKVTLSELKNSSYRNRSVLKEVKSNLKKTETQQEPDSQTSIEDSTLPASESSFNISTVETLQAIEEPKNPFLKNLKKAQTSSENPLSLTDKNAGLTFSEIPKKLASSSRDSGEKRKQPESDSVKQKEKQRKLDKFMFSGRS